MKISKTVGYHLRNAQQSVSRMYNSYASQNDISISMAYVLLLLDKLDGKPSTQIGPDLGMEASSITRLMKTMEDKKLIEKKQDKYDGRQVNVFLTALGEKKKIVAKATIKGFNDILKKQIPKEELNAFLDTLDKINQLAEDNYSNS